MGEEREEEGGGGGRGGIMVGCSERDSEKACRNQEERRSI